MLGQALVKHLLAEDHKVTILSRSVGKCPPDAEAIEADRIEGLNLLSKRKFNITVDFIAYDGEASIQVFDTIDFGFYILISTTWLTRLISGVEASQAVNSYDDDCSKSLPEITFNYLVGKMDAEKTAIEQRNKSRNATVLRLPIFWGAREHTGRVEFYCKRVMDGHPVICVDGGKNLAQIAWVEDLAHVCAAWIATGLLSEQPIWEALPDAGVNVRDIINHIAKGVRKDPRLVDVPNEVLSREIPEYLIEEPLWRETPLDLTINNLFTPVKSTPTPYSEWMAKVAESTCSWPHIDISELRTREIEFLKNAHYEGDLF